MTKIILIFWAFTSSGSPDKTIIDGWGSLDECVVAAESLTASNPTLMADMRLRLVAKCVEVPK
jgi:hypothetical protein